MATEDFILQMLAKCPALTRKSNSVHRWKILSFMDDHKNAGDVEKESTDVNSTVFPSSASVATSCNTCQGALIYFAPLKFALMSFAI
uniref:Uncharacterized protein n=1 Tax=Romanomermis culicivorax TaxID=13658 RepID=A0A915KX41_ROMCU